MKEKLMVIISILFLSLSAYTAGANETGDGDQFLDGIGETAMAVRYVFDGDAKDWTRNTFHAELVGDGGEYVTDEMFGTVLSLPGGREGAYIKLPGEALNSIESVSISGWFYLNESSRSSLFSFARGRDGIFSCSPMAGRMRGMGGGNRTRGQGSGGMNAMIGNQGFRGAKTVTGPTVDTGAWVHIGIVVNTVNKTMSLYKDGIKVGEVGEVGFGLDKVLDQEDADENTLAIGGGGFGGALAGKVSDFRVYRIALSDEQVKTIRNNALTDEVKVKSDLASLDLGELTERTSDLALLTEGISGSKISWKSSMPQYISATGDLTRPASTVEDRITTVTLTATAKVNDESGSKSFTVTIPRMPSDEDVVSDDMGQLVLGTIGNIELAKQGVTGAKIEWSSSNPDVISSEGKVTRPAPGTGNAEVVLTATISYGAASETKTFDVKVIAMPTNKEIVDGDLFEIELGDLSRVTEDLDLVTESKSGMSTISWTSSNSAALSTSGKVTRPQFEDGSVNVVLTVTAVRDDVKASKTFNAVVHRLPNTPILVEVPDIKAETVVGKLPHLPFYIEGKYRDGVKGPEVRVNWPAPTNNAAVAKAGTYTVTGVVADTKFAPKAVVTVKASKATIKPEQLELEAFDLGDVLLNKYDSGEDTQFIKNRDKFINTLAATNPDNFLYNFRDAFGQEQPEGVRPLGGWDSQTTRLRGHASGHYLSAIAQAYASTSYDKELHENFGKKIDYMIEVLYDLSQKSGKPVKEGGEFNADPTKVPVGPGREGYDSDLTKEGIRTDYWNWGKGFISGYPPDQFIMLEHGASYGGSNSQIWAPYYTLHKIIAGLLDCYEVGGNEKALTIAKDMGIWVHTRLKEVPTETLISMWNRYIAGEYGGMNEAMARLYRLTNDKRYIEGAQLFDNISFFFGDVKHSHGLAKNVDTVRAKHANQHIPQIIGSLETYKGTHNMEYYDIADNFWDIFHNCYMYNIGGVAGARNPNNSEMFTGQPNTLFVNGFNSGGQNESCATYNLLKLSRQMFMFDQNGKFMDYYEQGLYNHILASVAENNAGNTYHVPLNPGARKSFGNANMTGFTCCNGTGLESSTKLQDSIYFKSIDDKQLYVNLYVPSTVTWKAQKTTITQDTDYPYGDTTKISIKGGGKFDINVRVPIWATNGFCVKINGKVKNVKAELGSYVSVGDSWKNGDTIELTMPFSFYLRPLMDKPNIASIFYGPVLLAAQETENLLTWRPITLDAEDISKSITGDPSTLTFETNGVTLKPFYLSYERHSVYFDVTLD